ncbi:MAG: hypothetical protein G01um101425_636 [Candidatus Peregrinibacteria bacterium Gr01-1014_25]|nr:MAG: hypothetical protein G01um101425_636 [Candidatus Peregrinibacteria bacterium Gr01-1014_25]
MHTQFSPRYYIAAGVILATLTFNIGFLLTSL